MTISLASLMAFATAVFILAATPGPAFFSLTTRSVVSGIAAGAGVVTGIAVADLIFLSLAIIGMTKLAQDMATVFLVIKVVGGAYLIWMGIKMLRSNPLIAAQLEVGESKSYMHGLLEGLAVNLANPKAIIFFAAILPAFFDLPALTMKDCMIIAGVLISVTSTTDLVVVLMASKARTFITGERGQRLVARVGGGTLIAVGVGTASH